MKDNIMKKLNIEIEINNYLNDIKGYTESAYNYFTNFNEDLDKDEIMDFLSTVPEICNLIDKLIYSLEEIYESELNISE